MLGLICIFTSIAGVIYEIVDTGALSFMSVLIGLPIGLVYAVLELYVFTNRDLWINKLSFIKLILAKAFLYTAFAFVFINLVGLINGFLDGKSKDEFYESLVSSNQLMLLVVLALYLMIAFFLQINRLLGEGKLLKYLLGKYYQPVREDRIFMFLDIKSSTHIAEKFGNKIFYSWLNDFFHEISDPVTSTKAEIYQYVGDEVVFTWEISNGFAD